MPLSQGQNKRLRMGQAATELAVFGAVLIFLIGGIVRNSLTASQNQNAQLKAMRMALLKSYQSSQDDGVGRNTATVVYLEDRLTPTIDRYGANERIQLFTMGSGAATSMLYYPLDPDEVGLDKNIQMTDFFINGVHLPLSSGMVVQKTFAPPSGYPASFDNQPLPSLPNGLQRFGGWNFNCLTKTDSTKTPPKTTIYGCPLFYDTTSDGKYGELTVEEAYDLNRNDKFDDDPKAILQSGKLARGDMAWHWRAVSARDLKINVESGDNTRFDVDGDLHIEQILDFKVDENDIITQLTVFDSQEGDLDAEKLVYKNRKPGLQNDMSIFTQDFNGTYLLIKEGKAYNPENGAFVRSINFKDQVEVIQRMIQLTKNTGRFCNGAGVRAQTLPDGSENPIEVCGTGGASCFSPNNINKTCFDINSHIIYVRTRILDRTGHAWLTDTKGRLP